MSGPRPDRSRILFLDDDPERAARFLARHESAVWVQTARQCLELLASEPWDEVHLDHDLGGERGVDLNRVDCGMEIVRWLCRQPHPHLESTCFVIHTHNPTASSVMAFHLQAVGFEIRVRPFGTAEKGRKVSEHGRDRGLLRDVLGWFRRSATGAR